MDLKGKAALITGGARVGQDVAVALAARGCSIAFTYRKSKDKAEEGAARVRALGASAAIVRADLTKPADIERVVPAVKKALGRLDVLVAMASPYYEASLERLAKDPAPYQESLDVEARSAFLLALSAVPLMRRGGGGRIVLFSDWLPASDRPRYKRMLPYYVAKGAVKSLTEALALELAPDILVNAIAPGPILPPPTMVRKTKEKVEEQTPLGRWGGAAEIAKAVLFFIESDFVTGETLRVDGGRHLL